MASPPPRDGGPGAIFLANDNTVESVNLITGSTVPVFTDPTALVLNDLAFDVNRNMFYYIKNIGGGKVYEIDYYNYTTKTFGILTNGLAGVSGGAPFPDLNQSGACMANNGKLYIACQTIPFGVNRQTRIYEITMDGAGVNITSAKDYIWLKNNFGGPIQFGDFVIDNNLLICTVFDGTYRNYNLPPVPPASISPPGIVPSLSVSIQYSQIATGWDGTIYTIGSGTDGVTYFPDIYRVTDILSGASANTGIRLPPAGVNSGQNYKDAAGPVPATATIKGNLNCYPPNTQVDIWYDADQDGTLSAKDKLVFTTSTDASGNYSVGSLIPDYYVLSIAGGLETFSTKFNYASGLFLNIGETWVQNKTTGGSCSVLPLTMHASAQEEQNTIVLKWSTDVDRSNPHVFEVERSDDGINFTVIGSIKSGDFPDKWDYRFTDIHPVQGNNFYRIRQVSPNGRYINSNIEKVYFNSAENIHIFYGPDRQSITITMKAALKKQLDVRVVNNLGQIVTSFSVQPGRMSQQIRLSSIGTGIYYVQIQNDDVHYVQKLMIP